MINQNKPGILIAGATGIVGQHLLKELAEQYTIYAWQRRPQRRPTEILSQSGDIHWMTVDIGDPLNVREATHLVKESGPIEFIFHLAGYYDFENIPHPEFEYTNINGTRYLLEAARELAPKRLIFTSSLTVSNFDDEGSVLNENSPADENFPYAWSKREAEKILFEYSQYFPVTVVRLAAVFTDWCEYAPLFMFLMTWLTPNWKSRILGGRGTTSIPYLHVRELVRFLKKIMLHTSQLKRFDILIASPRHDTSHNELFRQATSYFFGVPRKPFHMPHWISGFGVWLLDILGQMVNRRPFERPWMIHYIDKQMRVDPSYSYRILNWQPKPRYAIERRLLFMLEYMKSDPFTWQKRNMEAMHTNLPQGRHFLLMERMISLESSILEYLANQIKNNGTSFGLIVSQRKSLRYIMILLGRFYLMFKQVVRSRDRIIVLESARHLVLDLFKEGFEIEEMTSLVRLLTETCNKRFKNEPALHGLIDYIDYEINLTGQILIDEMESLYQDITGFD